MKKLFTLMLFISVIFWNINLFSQEEPVENKKQEETKEIQKTEQSEEVKKENNTSEESVTNNEPLPNGVLTGGDEEPSKAPEIKTFALDPNQVGALANSVNLFTGQVNLPINLISMSGRNGLDVNVSISYSSNVKNIVDTWNLEAPTGVLGLGWQFGHSQIVVDHKGTGTREDDEFYLIEGGSSNKLVCDQINTGNRKYKTKNYQFWDITYYNTETTEQWVIVKENGVKYIYGGDLSSNRHTVQYSSKWGNWIGNSKQDFSTSIAVAWNLSKVQNIWGEEITFEYDVVEYTLTTTNGSSKQTEACYLKKITDNFNRQIEFCYGNKYNNDDNNGIFEYLEPHTEQAEDPNSPTEPDAYQERFERKYLDSVVVRNANSFRLFSIVFGYDPDKQIGDGNLYKRQLTSITQKNSNWEILPGISFTYNTTETNVGALKKVDLPLGASVNYTYGSHQIDYSDLDDVANAPTGGYLEPKVFVQDNYVVITWRNSSPEHTEDYKDVKVQIWEWDGKWIKALEQSIGSVKMINGYQDFTITFQDDFFAILTASLYKEGFTDARGARLYTFSKDHSKKGTWNGSSAVNLSYASFNGQVVSGRDFVAARISQSEGTPLTLDWKIKDYLTYIKKTGMDWTTLVDKSYIGQFATWITLYPHWSFTGNFLIAAENNFLLLFNNTFNPDHVKFYYLSADGALNETAYHPIGGINTNNGWGSKIYTNGFSLALFGSGTNEYIFDWNESFTGLTERTVMEPYPDNSSVFPMSSGYGIMKGDMFRSILCRKNGINWIQSSEGLHKENAVAFGEDFYLWTEQGTTSDQDVTLRQFCPNNSTWSDILYPLGSYHVKKTGLNLFSLNEKVYNRQPSGSWTLNSSTLYEPPGGIENYTITHGNRFSVYENSTGSSINTYFVPQKNNQILTATTLSDQKVWHYFGTAYYPMDKSELAGSNTFVTYSSSYNSQIFRDVASLYLYKVINNNATGKLTEYFVKGFTINDGYNSNSTAIHYYPSYGKMDPTGSVIQYNKVRVIPGGSLTSYNPDVHNNGYTDTYFFNGLAPTDLSSTFPSGTNTNAFNNYMLLTGLPYKTEVCNSTGTVKSSTTNYWWVYSKPVNNTICYYTRLLQKDEILDGVTRTTESTYLTTSGLVKTQQTKNFNTAGVEENLKTEYTYGYENDGVYGSLLGLNLLTPVIQTRSFNGTTCTGMSATTLQQVNGVWAPHKSYIRSTAGSTDFNFDSWSGSSEPTTEWLKTSEITGIDIQGQVVEVKDVDGLYSATHWDRNGLQVASFTNTQNATRTLSENFDDLSFIDGKPVSWTGTGGWAINSLGVLCWPTNTESTIPFYSTQQTPTDFIAEFDVRIPSALTTGDWGGFQFRKSTASATPFNSGYTVFLSKNGRLDLYSATGTTLGYYQLSGTDVASDWQRIRVVASGAFIQVYVNGTRRINYSGATSFFGTYTSFYAYRSQAQFDNLIIYPENAYASMIGYDPKFLVPLKGIDAKGNTVKNVYDSFQRKVGTVGPTNIPISTGSAFLSTDRYNGNFNVDDPNSSLSTTVHGNFGLYNDFSTHLNSPSWQILDNSNNSTSTWILEDGKLKHYNSGSANNQLCDFLYLDLGSNLTGRVGIEFNIKIDEACEDINFGIGLGDNAWTINSSSEANSAVWTRFFTRTLWQIKDGSTWVNAANWLKPNRYYRIKIVIDVSTKTVDYFINGKALLNNKNFVNLTNSNIRKLAFFNYGYMDATTWYIDDLMVYTEPSHSMTFTDAVGKTLQTQTEESSSSIICSETLYDVLARGYVQTMPVRLTANWLGYVPGFVTSFIDGTGAIAGSVLTGSVDTYPYSRTVYELSPLSRAIEQGKPGNELRIGNGHTIQNSFSKNTSGQFPINYPTGQGFVTQSINADGVNAWELKDKLGRIIATKTGPVKGSSISTLYISLDEFNTPSGEFTPNVSGTATYSFDRWSAKAFYIGTTKGGSEILYIETSGTGTFNVTEGTTYYLTIANLEKKNNDTENSNKDKIESIPVTTASVDYPIFVSNVDIYPVSTNEFDISGNLVKIYPPNYYNIPDPSFDKNKYIINMTYDFNGRLKTKQSSDYDTVRYVYDKAGRLRFSMDANGESQTTDNIKYIKYDGLGRVSEEGYIVQNWNESTLQNYANTNPSWPTTPTTWRKKYTYGAHGSDVFQRGEVTQVQVNNDANLTAEVTETYTYNILGDITTVSTTTNGINQAISYTYNYDGQAATINYGTTTVYYGYDRLGRVSTIGTSSDADYYASYSYANYNGSLYQEKLNNNTVTRTLSYNNHGWLSQINDDNYFKEVITYHSDGYGGAAYYNGNISKILINDPEQGAGYDYTMAFKYDNLGRMQVADVTDGMGANLNNYDIGVGTGYETKLDANGNLSFLREGTTNRNYKYFTGTNLIKNTDGSSNIYYTHDKNGNVTYSPYPKEWQYSYDPYFNLTTGVNFEEYSETIMYGADNERVFKQYIPDPVTNYAYKTYYYRGLSEYPLVEKNYQNSTLISTTLYIYGPTGLIAVKDGSTFNYILKDHLGSTRVLINSSNLKVAKYHYSPYGRIMYSYVNTNVAYKFTGQEFDDETGLHNFRARLYDAELGMFYAYDPAAQGFSPFGYVVNNPIIYIDPTGKFIFSALLPGIGTFIDAMLWGAVIGGTVQGITTNSWEGVWKGAIVGSVGGLLAPIGGAGLTFTQDVLLGGFEGAFTGSLNSMLWNTDVGNGMLWGGISGAAFASLTSPYTKNLIRGEGFNSNSEVFDNMIARGTDRQEILDYFGMEGTYNPNLQGPDYVPNGEGYYGQTNPLTGNISYGDLAFDSYDRLYSTYLKEDFTRKMILSGEVLTQEITDEFPAYFKVAPGEAKGFLFQYKNNGLYPSVSASSIISQINAYRQQILTFNYLSDTYKGNWWSFIYRIPRRF